MILAHGSTGGLPDFVELIQISVVHGWLHCEILCVWYAEHLKSYELENTISVKVIEPSELTDSPVVAYTVAGKCMVTQKHYIYTP